MATAIGGIIRVDRMKNSRSSLSGTRKREKAKAAKVPSDTARNVEPNAITRELRKRSPYFDGPAMTIPRERTSLSHQVSAGGRLWMYSGVCRLRVVNRFT